MSRSSWIPASVSFSHMRAVVLVAVLLTALYASGCGGKSTSSGTGTAPGIVPTVERPERRGCRFLTAKDVSRVTGGGEPRTIDLAPPRNGGQVCATVFAGAGGSLVAAVTERTGGERQLRQLREQKVAELGATHVRDATALGPGAFLARERSLSFRRGDRVITLDTSYDAQGRLAISVAELTRLALVVADRL